MMHGTIRFNDKYYFVFMLKDDKRKYYISSEKVVGLTHMGVSFKPFPHFTINDPVEENFIKENSEWLVLPRKLWEARMSPRSVYQDGQVVNKTV